MEILKKSKVLELINNLSNFYECNLEFLKEYIFLENKSRKVHIFKGELLEINKINSVGLYFGTFHDNERFRLSIEGSRLITANNNFIELNEKSFLSYITAENLFIEEIENIKKKENCPFLIVKYNGENLGSISIKEKEILNYIPKSRKLEFNKIF